MSHPDPVKTLCPPPVAATLGRRSPQLGKCRSPENSVTEEADLFFSSSSSTYRQFLKIHPQNSLTSLLLCIRVSKSFGSHSPNANSFIPGQEALHCGGTDSPQAL
jgi:hypothetical protein